MTLSIGQLQNNPACSRKLPYIRDIVLLLLFLGICAGIFMPGFGPRTGRGAAISAAKIQMNAFKTALDMFNTDNGFYPSTAMGLQALVTQPQVATNWHQYLDAIPKDPWGHDYIYQFPGKHAADSFDIVSMGPDGRLGTRDDIMISK
jgi:general secretion pathway protein G